MTHVPAGRHKDSVNPAEKWGAGVGKRGQERIHHSLLGVTRPALRAGWVHATVPLSAKETPDRISSAAASFIGNICRQTHGAAPT